MALPEWAPRLDAALRNADLAELYRWWQLFSPFFKQRLDTQGDMTMTTKGKGIVVSNAAGTVTKRIRLNDAGDGIIFEDV